jgi:DNA-binding NarL/FixJ family response regulator
MTTSVLQLILIDRDPIFRLGFNLACEPFPDLQVVADVATGSEALSLLANLERETDGVKLDVVVWDLDFSDLKLCQELKSLYPNLPVLLLSYSCELSLLSEAKKSGVNGYCPKGRDILELLHGLRQVVSNQSYWDVNLPDSSLISSVKQEKKSLHYSLIYPQKSRLSQFFISGLEQIDYSLAEVSDTLQNASDLTAQMILQGRKRELLAARWLVHKFAILTDKQGRENREQGTGNREQGTGNREQGRRKKEEGNLSLISASESVIDFSRNSSKDLQNLLFDATIAQFQSGLENCTGFPVEIDILRRGKKQELLYIILRKFEVILDELRFSQVPLEQLSTKRITILQDLWSDSLSEFFGKYYTLSVPSNNTSTNQEKSIEIVPILLRDRTIVEQSILAKIPGVVDFLSHLLFETPLMVDNLLWTVNTPEAIARCEILLQNLVISLANAVMQPLLNNFADTEEIKLNFYDRRLLSTREIERFRNDLSWKYRLDNYIGEPKAIFESRFWLLILADRGIERVSIYGPRNEELRELGGLKLAVTLVLETRDAIAPRVRSFISFMGTGVVIILTQVIGRGIGLIGRGILQGIGNAWQETKDKR